METTIRIFGFDVYVHYDYTPSKSTPEYFDPVGLYIYENSLIPIGLTDYFKTTMALQEKIIEVLREQL